MDPYEAACAQALAHVRPAPLADLTRRGAQLVAAVKMPPPDDPADAELPDEDD